jgi:metal-sulfur cluster biosynthetic enzyme
MTTRAEILDALSGVRDPELDESLTDLGFVAGVRVRGASVHVRLRLPTYFCAPNFTYLMVSDAREAIRRVPGVERAEVQLEDHFAAQEINGAVGAGAGFDDAFPDETAGGLDELRDLFRRKALVARQSRLCDALLRSGASAERLAAMRLVDLPDGPDGRRCRALRAELGLRTTPESPAFVLADGRALVASQVPRFTRVARLVRLSLEGNGGLCRGLLKTRYGIEDPEEVAA